MNDNKCPKCGEPLQFLAGKPAHPDNRFCGCGYTAWGKTPEPDVCEECGHIHPEEDAVLVGVNLKDSLLHSALEFHFLPIPKDGETPEDFVPQIKVMAIMIPKGAPMENIGDMMGAIGKAITDLAYGRDIEGDGDVKVQVKEFTRGRQVRPQEGNDTEH